MILVGMGHRYLSKKKQADWFPRNCPKRPNNDRIRIYNVSKNLWKNFQFYNNFISILSYVNIISSWLYFYQPTQKNSHSKLFNFRKYIAQECFCLFSNDESAKEFYSNPVGIKGLIWYQGRTNRGLRNGRQTGWTRKTFDHSFVSHSRRLSPFMPALLLSRAVTFCLSHTRHRDKQAHVKRLAQIQK